MQEKNRSREYSDALKTLVGFIADPVVVLDSSGAIIAANQVVDEYTGKELTALVGKNLFEQKIFTKKQNEHIKINLSKRLSGLQIEPYEVTVKGKNGFARLEVNAKKIECSGKAFDVVVFRDVTKRYRQQKKLRSDLFNSELRFQAVSDRTFEGIVIFDKKDKIRYWNPAAEGLFGFKREEVLGKAMQQTIVPPNVRGLFAKIKNEFLNNPATAKRIREVPALKKDGTEFPTEMSVSALSIGNEELAFVMFRDITERRNAEHALKQQRDILEAVTSNTGVGLSLVSRDYRIFWTNNTMEQLFGKGLAGKTCFKQLHNRSSVCQDCVVQKIFNGESTATKECTGIDVYGNTFSLQITACPIKNKNGEVFAALEVAIPITHRKQMELKIEKAEKLYHALFDQAPLGIVVVDPNTTALIDFNEVAHQQLGYSREEFSQLRLLDLEVVESPRTIRDRFKRALKEDRIEFLAKHRTKTGEQRIVLVNKQKICISNRELLLATWHDITDINRMLDALHNSEERFYAIANSVKDALILVDDQAKVTFWNPAAEKTFGYTSQEAVSKNLHSLVVPKTICLEGRKRIKQGVKIFSETGMGYFTVGNVELVGRRKNGSEFPVELSLSPMKLDEKWHAVGIVKDATKRRLDEQSLRDAEQRYHALFNQAPLGVLVVDAQTNTCVEFNDIAHLQLGYTREEFENMPISQIEVEESGQETKEHIKRMVENGGEEFETRHRTKNGEIRNVIVTTRAFQSGNKKYLHSIFHDITESKKVQNALIASEARYRQLVEVAQEGIWAVDSNFVTTFVNPRMAQMLGFKECEMLGKQLFDFIDTDRVGIVKRAVSSYYNHPETKAQYEYAFPRKDGGLVDTTISMSIITDEHRRKTGILAVISDITERKLAEKALKKNEELSKAVVANAPIGIATSDSTYHFVSANEAFCKILGYTEEELRNLTFKDISDPQSIEASTKKMEALEKGQVPYFMQEKCYLKKDGSKIVGRVIINALRNPNGKPVLFVVELEDITNRKQLENELRSSEERFRAISTSALDALILSDKQDRIMYWNPAAEKTFGFTADEAVGRKITDLVIPHSVLNGYTRMLKELTSDQNAKWRKEVIALRKDRSTFTIDLSVVPIKVEGQNCILSISRDITERKAMEEALRQEKDLLESVTTSTDIVLMIVDRDYRIIWANQRAKQAMGINPIENKYCHSVFGNGSPTICLNCGVKKVFEEGASIARRDYNIRPDSDDKWVELVSTPMKDKDGNVIAALEIAIDITERKRLQERLGEYSQRLEELVAKRTEQLKKTQAELVKSERLAAIGELAGMIGHDLRNPLTGIKNSAYFLKKKVDKLSLSQVNEMLETIDKCVDYSNRIINDLLDYSKEIHLSLEAITPKILLEESLPLIGIPANVKVISKLEEKPALRVDQNKIKRVFINLIKNAVDAMPNGGTITISSTKTKDFLEISFTDTGEGISSEILPNLFAPLFTTKAQGMGFGLAICKRIVEAHGGLITVETQEGHGTTFTVTLPIDQKNETGGENIWINILESSLSTTMKP
ncbi:MAG: PAS domain S-box protein [Candidatus Bathyarchaeia archaeon]|jgi:PAS domain S-box-containing protein